MDDLSKVRVQVLNPETGSVIENVDMKTSDGAVYLSDGTTLRNWINNSETVNANVQKILATHLANSKTYSVLVSNIDPSSWNTETVGFSRTVTVNGIRSTDNPIIGLKIRSTTKKNIEAEKYAYSCIDSIVTGDDSITLYCFEEIPITDITLLLSCV